MRHGLVPVMIDFAGRRVVVVGGGAIGLRKAKLFIKAGADVHVVSREFAKGFDGMKVTRVRTKGRVDARMVEGALLVVAATDDPRMNAEVAMLCRARGVLCNIVDDPSSEVYMSSVITRGPLTVGIGTRGASPALSRHARLALEKVMGPEWGRMALLQEEARAALKTTGRSPAIRRRVLNDILEDGDIWDELRSRHIAKARRIMRERHLEGMA